MRLQRKPWDSDLVLDKYAEVCRRYGKPPSSVELRFYARESGLSFVP